MRKVRKLPCIVLLAWRENMVEMLIMGEKLASCEGRMQADHMGERALSRKAADVTCVGICKKHHGERTDYRGAFKGFTKVEMRRFCDWAIERTRRELEEMNRGK